LDFIFFSFTQHLRISNLNYAVYNITLCIAEFVRAFSLFCVLPAATGGVNQWIDPQVVYLLLREDNADVVKALTHPQAMSIPEHTLDGQVRLLIRGVDVGGHQQMLNDCAIHYYKSVLD
jgi:hypothetical protein